MGTAQQMCFRHYMRGESGEDGMGGEGDEEWKNGERSAGGNDGD